MGLRWMVSPSLPLLISLSSHPPLFPPPSLHCSGQLPSITVTGRPQHRGRLCVWIGEWGGREGRRRRCVYGCDERRRQLLTYQRTVYVYRCVCMCVGMRGCFRACAFVCLCDMPMGQLLATHHGCCSNEAVTTTVWHLWRINIFHLEWSYYPPLVVVKKKKLKNIMTPAAMIVGISLYVQPYSLCRIHCHNR